MTRQQRRAEGRAITKNSPWRNIMTPAQAKAYNDRRAAERLSADIADAYTKPGRAPSSTRLAQRAALMAALDPNLVV